jgi:hypothetical protein
MKVTVGLFGIHYVDTLNHWLGWKHGVDYRKTFHNQFTQIYSSHDVKYYSATYYSDIQNELLTDYNFTSITFSEIDNTSETDPRIKRNKVFKNTIKLILEDTSDCDLVILTRYDLYFKKNFYSLDINFDKVNFLCGVTRSNRYEKKNDRDTDLVDDNFYCIPRDLLQSFYDTIETIPETIPSHKYHKWFDDYHLMISGRWYSSFPVYRNLYNNVYYNIVRIPNNSDRDNLKLF